jgi:hypothetical protein
MQKRRLEPVPSSKDRLAAVAKETREKADQLQPGMERDEMLKKARRAETEAHLNDWANSSGLQTPK